MTVLDLIRTPAAWKTLQGLIRQEVTSKKLTVKSLEGLSTTDEPRDIYLAALSKDEAVLKALTKHSNTVVSAIARTNLYYMHSDFPAKDLPELLFTGITANGKTEVETHINGRSYKVKSKKENL